MKKESEYIIELIQKWQAFSREEADWSLASFARWHYRKTWLDKEPPKHEMEELYASPEREDEQEAHLHWAIGVVWGRLSRFSDILEKKAFQELPIRSFEDYTILKSIEYAKALPKSELAQLAMLEPSTCFEILKRLIHGGLLSENISPEDRRIRIVSLTGKGKQVIEEADMRAFQVALLLPGDFNQSERKELLTIFQKMDAFHTRLHEENPDASLKEMIRTWQELKPED